jgi:hypothetical protein
MENTPVNSWTLIATVAIPLAVAAIERGFVLLFLARAYRLGGLEHLPAAASATRHLVPEKNRPRARFGAGSAGRLASGPRPPPRWFWS